MIVVLALVAALVQDGGAAATADAAPPAAAQRVRITVRAIAAGSDGSGMDPKLAAIEPHISALGEQMRFSSYRLLEEQTFDLDWKTAAQLELPGSRSLQITPRAISGDGRIKVHLELLGEHPAHSRKLHTDYSIQRGGTLLVGGLHVDPGDVKSPTLLIAVTQAVEK